VTLAHSSGVKCGLGRRVVQNSLKLSVKSTCRQPARHHRGVSAHTCLVITT
jgi:hypothetical protein